MKIQTRCFEMNILSELKMIKIRNDLNHKRQNLRKVHSLYSIYSIKMQNRFFLEFIC